MSEHQELADEARSSVLALTSLDTKQADIVRAYTDDLIDQLDVYEARVKRLEETTDRVAHETPPDDDWEVVPATALNALRAALSEARLDGAKKP